MMRSKYFSFGFAKDIGEFVIFGGDLEKVRNFCKFCGVDLNVQRVKTEFEIAKAWKF